jgi:hypothetical protein
VILVLLLIDKLGTPALTLTDITFEVTQLDGEVAVKE